MPYHSLHLNAGETRPPRHPPQHVTEPPGPLERDRDLAGEAVDALLTVDKTAIQQRTAVAAQAALDRNRSGVRIVGVQLLESAPPPEVAQAFRDVASAREDQNTFINEAVAYRNEVLPIARGDADKTGRQR